MKKFVFLLMVLLSSSAFASANSDKQQILSVLHQQQNAWNQGNIPGFMQGYWHSPKLRFTSGGQVSYGWQQAMNHYQAHYKNKAAMGKLLFDIKDVQLFDDHAVVFGHWQLNREKDQPQGYFTLVLAKLDGSWKITADHTSAARPAKN